MTTRSRARDLFARAARPGVEALEVRAAPANYSASSVTELIAGITAANQTAQALA